MTAGRVAALDIGSNSIHLLVCEPSPDGWRELYREAVITRLGASLARDGTISQEAVQRGIDAVSRLAGAARASDAQLLVFATEAVRSAGNGSQVVAELSRVAAVPVEVITGEEEARLTYLGARTSRGLEAGQAAIVVDVGGASTEVARGTGSVPDLALSVPLGSGSLTEQCLSDPPSRAECRVAYEAACDAFHPVAPLSQHGNRDVSSVLITGGTASTLVLLTGGAALLDSQQLEEARTTVLCAPARAVAMQFGIEEGRARVIGGGIEICAALLLVLKVRSMTVVPEGIRLGAIVSHFGDGRVM